MQCAQHTHRSLITSLVNTERSKDLTGAWDNRKHYSFDQEPRRKQGLSLWAESRTTGSSTWEKETITLCKVVNVSPPLHVPATKIQEVSSYSKVEMLYLTTSLLLLCMSIRLVVCSNSEQRQAHHKQSRNTWTSFWLFFGRERSETTHMSYC